MVFQGRKEDVVFTYSTGNLLVGLPIRRSVVGVPIVGTLYKVYGLLLTRHGKEFADDYCLSRQLNFRACDAYRDAVYSFEDRNEN